MLWRHGDVLIASIPQIPAGTQPRHGTVLVYGEATGHAHRIEDPGTAEILARGNELFLRVLSEARIVHEEHLPITLPAGTYRVWQQREYSPTAIRYVFD